MRYFICALLATLSFTGCATLKELDFDNEKVVDLIADGLESQGYKVDDEMRQRIEEYLVKIEEDDLDIQEIIDEFLNK